jgi:hypothetical protein
MVDAFACIRLPMSTCRRPTRPATGRRDAAILQIELRDFERGAVGGDRGLILRDGGDLRGVGLIGNRVLRQQSLVALQIDLGVGEQSLIVLELTGGLIDGGLIGSRIDQHQQVAGLDRLSLGEGDLDQRSVDLRVHGDRGQRRHGAERIDGDRDVALTDAGNADRQRTVEAAASGGGRGGRAIARSDERSAPAAQCRR